MKDIERNHIIWIPGVSGLLRLHLLDRLAGRRDAKRECSTEENTSWINRKIELLKVYLDWRHERMLPAIEKKYKEANNLLAELKLILSHMGKEDTATPYENKEEASRQMAQRAAKAKQEQGRAEEIILALTELGSWADTMKIRLSEVNILADNKTRAHITSYIRGADQAGKNITLQPYGVTNTYANVQGLLNEILAIITPVCARKETNHETE